jgi:cytoskeleton protein RodZ
LLRAAREARGVHIAALAAAIKVSPRKLEALEAGRFDELSDPTFTRALAQAVCRHLKTDPAPVLALLPAAASQPLGRVVHGGLNERFSASGATSADATSPAGQALALLLRRPLWLAALGLAVAALAVALWPTSAPVVVAASEPAAALAPPTSSADAASVAGAAAASAPVASATNLETVHSAPGLGDLAASAPLAAVLVASAPMAGGAVAAIGPPAAGSAAAAPAGTALVLRSNEPSWVEVRDGQGGLLLSRTLLPGESVSIDGSLPLRATIGNAAATQASFRGQALNLAAVTRDNVARLELK